MNQTLEKLTSSQGNSESPDKFAAEDEQAKKAKADAELVQWVRAQYEKCKGQRAQQQKAWEFNLLSYGGDQWRRLISGKLETPKAPTWRSKLVTNLIRPAVRQQITRMTNQKPSVSILPVSTSEDDIFAAQAGEAVWDSLYSRKRFHALYQRAAFWVVTTGNGFMKTWWDPNKVDKNFMAINPMLQKPVQMRGDIEYGVVTPFNLFVPDLLVEDIEDQPFIIEAYTRPVLWVNTVWKQYLKYPVQADCVTRSEIFNTAYWNANGNDGSAVPDAVLVIECWMKPGAHAACPNGGMLTIIGDQLVQQTEGLPYSHGEYPIAHWGDIPTGKFYRESMVTDLIPINQQYNRTRNQMIESMIRTARTQIMYTEGSIDPNRVTSRPGELIPVKPGYQMPQALPAQPIPQFVTDELRILKQDFEDISGQHAVSKGQAGGVIAATAINYLQEQDDTMNYTAYSSGEFFVEKIGKQSLSIVADMWSIPRIIRTIGTDRSFDVIELKGSQIANGLDLRVEAGSSLAKSKTARQALLMDMAKMGFITPQQLLDLIDMGGTQKLTEILRVDMYEAQRENLTLKKLQPMQIQMADMQYELGMQPDPVTGEIDPNTIDPGTGMTLQRPCMVPVHDWQNHKVHIDVHNRFRKSQEFQFLDPIVQREFQNHILLHQVQLIMSEQRSGMMMQGGPPPGMMDPNMAGIGMDNAMMGGEIPNGDSANYEPGGGVPGSGQA